jgi:hypothetical protein
MFANVIAMRACGARVLSLTFILQLFIGNALALALLREP